MATPGPEQGLAPFAALAVVVAFFSASQDIVIDAWRTDLVSAAERGPAATAANLGYRLAAWFSFAGALILADLIGWRSTYFVMAGGMLAVTLVTFLAPEPEQRAPPPRTLQEAVTGPLRQLLAGEGMLLLLLTIVLYKVGDAFALKLLTPFLMDVGFSKTEIGAVTKTVMLIANIAGAVVGGLWLVALGLVRALMLFGIVQAIANLGYFLVAIQGDNLLLMSVVVFSTTSWARWATRPWSYSSWEFATFVSAPFNMPRYRPSLYCRAICSARRQAFCPTHSVGRRFSYSRFSRPCRGLP